MSVFPAVRPAVSPAVRGAFEQSYGGGAVALIKSLFAAGQQGFWLPFTDFDSLTQDSAGTLPYTALEQPVGRVLDKRFDGALGTELATIPCTKAGWVTGSLVTSTQVGDAVEIVGVGNISGDNSRWFSYPQAATIGKFYTITFEAKLVSGGDAYCGSGYQTSTIPAAGNSGAFKSYTIRNMPITASSNGLVVFGAASGAVWQFRNVSCKEVLGNHAVQPTSTARGVVSARVNLLTNTEQFDEAVWVKENTTITANASTAPDETIAADKLVENSGSAVHVARQTYSNAGNYTYTLSCFFKRSERSVAYVRMSDGVSGNAFGYVDLDTMVVSTSGSTVWVNVSVKAEVFNDGWVRLSVTGTRNNTANVVLGYVGMALSMASPVYVGDGVSGIYIWGASITIATDANLPYQRVNTPTDYDAVGFPKYAKLEVDDYYTCGGGGSSTGFYYAGVIQLAVNASHGIFQDAVSNKGYIFAVTGGTLKLKMFAGNGTSYTTFDSATSLTVGQKYFVEFYDDGVNLGIVVDGGTPTTVPRPAVQGGLPTIQLFNVGGVPTFNGNITEPIYRAGPPPSAYERSVIRGYQMQKAGL